MDAQESSIEGVKKDKDKPRMDMLPPVGLVKIAEVMSYGANKYGDFNFRLGMRYGRLLAAALRHITAYMGGEDNDKESGLSHIAHAGACMAMLCQLIADHPELDDRYKEKTNAIDVAKDRNAECGVCVAGSGGLHSDKTPEPDEEYDGYYAEVDP